MASKFGRAVRKRRKELGLSLRELARRIEKSPSFLTAIENENSAPSASEETIRAIASELELDPDQLIVLAGKTPHEVTPATGLDVAIYRQVKQMSEKDKKKLLQELGGDED